jgi:hypothetical protein
MTNPDIEKPHQDFKEVFFRELLVVDQFYRFAFIDGHKELDKINLFLLPLDQCGRTSRRKEAELATEMIFNFLPCRNGIRRTGRFLLGIEKTLQVLNSMLIKLL